MKSLAIMKAVLLSVLSLGMLNLAHADQSIDFKGKQCVEAIKEIDAFAGAELYIANAEITTDEYQIDGIAPTESYTVLSKSGGFLFTSIVDFYIKDGRCLKALRSAAPVFKQIK